MNGNSGQLRAKKERRREKKRSEGEGNSRQLPPLLRQHLLLIITPLHLVLPSLFIELVRRVRPLLPLQSRRRNELAHLGREVDGQANELRRGETDGFDEVGDGILGRRNPFQVGIGFGVRDDGGGSGSGSGSRCDRGEGEVDDLFRGRRGGRDLRFRDGFGWRRGSGRRRGGKTRGENSYESSLDERFETVLGELVLEGVDSCELAFDLDGSLRRVNENAIAIRSVGRGTGGKRGVDKIRRDAVGGGKRGGRGRRR